MFLVQIGSSFKKVKCPFIVLNRRVCFILFYRVSAHKNGARAGKENIFLTYKQVMKMFSLPTCSTIPTSYLARAVRHDK